MCRKSTTPWRKVFGISVFTIGKIAWSSRTWHMVECFPASRSWRKARIRCSRSVRRAGFASWQCPFDTWLAGIGPSRPIRVSAAAMAVVLGWGNGKAGSPRRPTCPLVPAPTSSRSSGSTSGFAGTCSSASPHPPPPSVQCSVQLPWSQPGTSWHDLAQPRPRRAATSSVTWHT